LGVGFRVWFGDYVMHHVSVFGPEYLHLPVCVRTRVLDLG